MQTLLGLPRAIFNYTTIAHANRNSSAHILVQDNGTLDLGVIGRLENPAVFAHTSTYSVRDLDTRMSIDISCTFPNASKMSFLNGVENKEYVLGRFWLNDYKKLETKQQFNDDGFTGKLDLQESSILGLEDLARGNPGVETNFLLPGNIQLVKLKLNTRYFEGDKIITRDTVVGPGFWSLKMLFTKKT